MLIPHAGPEPRGRPGSGDRSRAFVPEALLLANLLAGCTLLPSPSPLATPTATVAPTASPSVTASPPGTASPSPIGTPSPTPEPPLSLPPPVAVDGRLVSAAVAPNVAPDGDGQLVVTVTNLADTRIDEIVVRWPTLLDDSLFLAPFVPSEDRVRDGGPPLVQAWTKWVVGPGERGEPDGTVSLGYGPMDPGMTLEIPLYVTRRAVGAVEFDLQLLAGEAILAFEAGAPAELRVAVP